jgi:hypothetical protein
MEIIFSSMGTVAMNKTRLLLFLGLLVTFHGSLAQERLLKKRVTLSCQSCTPEYALEQLSRASGISFSYNADILPSGALVTVNMFNISADQVIKNILGQEILAKEVGHHVILMNPISQKKFGSGALDITGVISDSETGMPLAGVTVYDIVRKNSTISGSNGKYRLTIPVKKTDPGLVFCKRGYQDTVVFTGLSGNTHKNIMLRAVPAIPEYLAPRAADLFDIQEDSPSSIRWFIPGEVRINAENLQIGDLRTFQVSLLPFVGTNWRVSGSVTNRFSMNILAGYTGGLHGFELGGLLNVTRNHVRGIQICGIGNVVGKKVQGIQVAGVVNVTSDSVKGTQVAGVVNTGSGIIDGVQVAGLLNVSSRKIYGMQIAGILNYAKTLNGVQLGMINIAKWVEKGVPVGLFSYVQEGYHLFEFSSNEIFYGNVAFKSGTRHFYNFFQLGAGSDFKFQGSYGLGTMFTISGKMSVSIDASAGFVLHPVDTVYHGLLLKAYPAFEYRFARHFTLFGGPSWNFFLWSKGEPSATPRGLSPYDFYFRSTEHASIQMWFGIVAGIRF